MISASGKHLRVGVLGHQAGDVVAVEVRDDDGLDRLGIDTGRRHALRQDAGLWAARLSAASAGVDQHQAAARVDGDDRERDRHVGIGQAAGLERRLGLLDVGAFDEVLVVRLLPDAVVERDDLDIAHLVFPEVWAGAAAPALRR